MDIQLGSISNGIVVTFALLLGIGGGALAAWHVRGLYEYIRELRRRLEKLERAEKGSDSESALISSAAEHGRNSRLLVLGLGDAMDYLTQNNPTAAQEIMRRIAPHLFEKNPQ